MFVGVTIRICENPGAVYMFPRSFSALITMGAFGLALAAARLSPGADISFSKSIRPILSDRCFKCHGPDDDVRSAELRLDRRDGLFGPASSEAGVIVAPGNVEGSELYRRIVHADPDARMPPADSKLQLSDAEIALVRQWIEQGAPWEEHWSFAPVSDPEIPEGGAEWSLGAIDRFVHRKLQDAGMAPSPMASRERLARRLSYDLTGLPPSLDEIDGFIDDDSPAAIERYVDRLVASPRFGERFAVDWLDLSRYADTFGYQTDVYRATWPWRDWVVQSINANMPYDRFITLQLAGDLLPGATRDQVLATAFNRNHRQTNEGGSIEEEFRAEYVADRVNTFGAAFLGLTLECSRCHDHKYDPLLHRDYYSLAGFFNNIDESGLYSHFTDAIPTPTLLMASDEQESLVAATSQRIEALEASLPSLKEERRAAFASWLAAAPSEPATAGPIGDYPLEEIAENRVVNRAAADKPGTASESPGVVPGRVGNGLALSGENNIDLPAGGEFTRDDPFTIALWVKIPDRKDRAVIFHRSRAWTDAGSRG